GKEIARDLVASEQVEKVFLADVSVDPANEFVATLNTNKVEVVQLDADCDDDLRKVISKGQVVINALFYTFNERVARAAIDVEVHSVDLGGHIGGVTE
ncbi:MAG: saccharopine dehydrogenase NADP-binding domain-containing protein, partial [Solibacillus sp.]